MLKCEGCGKELADDAKVCDGCGRAVGSVQHAYGETKAMTGKLGRGLMSGVKAVGTDVKKIGKKKDGTESEPPPPPPPPPP
jgi:uncharacterized membrane protein YvbJ